MATALIGLHAALVEYVRRRVLEDDPDVLLPDVLRPDVRRMARGLRVEGQRAIELLATGLAGYAVKADHAVKGVKAVHAVEVS